MIDISTIEVSGFEGAIKGMRNPFKNREKSDSFCKFDEDYDFIVGFTIGPKDLELCQKLLRAGGDDDSKFMRMIHVQADINAPLYWWKEFDTYKVATVANSESTMHTITKFPFKLEDFSYDGYSEYWEQLVSELNQMRELYLAAKNDKDKVSEAYNYWRQMIQMLPSSYMQKRTVDLNYQTLRRMYFARRHHKLNEWSGKNGFCGWIKTLPYAEELIIFESQVSAGSTVLKKKEDK